MVYIRGTGVISIQEPLSQRGVFGPVGYAAPQVRCVEPDFRRYLDPIAARRMSRVVKRSIVTSTQALEEAGIGVPDAIISGTGLGCVEDTEKFLEAMVRNGEQCLQPTFFIQSTHNTISSQIAIRLQCHGYNNTHVHRGVSFESALQEALLLFDNGHIRSALVGGYDELTPAYFRLLGRLGYWRGVVEDTLRITQLPGKASFSGEGSVCFMLSDEQGENAYARVEGAGIFYRNEDLRGEAERFLKRCGVSSDEVQVVMTGRNGDSDNDGVYDTVKVLPGKEEAVYKPLCGEFFTAPAYGMFTAAACLKAGHIPAHLNTQGEVIKDVRRILLFNHWQRKNYSFILLSSCGS